MKHFRPRYSLLALLLFTAFVAGGVKLWRGPHHVVDRSNSQMEDEYTYYRDWDGTKIVDGVRVRRYFVANNTESAYLDYYRDGERLPLLFWITKQNQQSKLAYRIIPRIIPGLMPHEEESLRVAMLQVLEEIQRDGAFPNLTLFEK